MGKKKLEKKPILKKIHPENRVASIKTMYKFAPASDLLILLIGVLSTVISASMPIILIIRSGDMIDEMDAKEDDYDDFYDAEKKIAYLNYILGAFSVIIGWISTFSLIVVGCRQGLYWKQAYFAAAVNKPVKWYDKHNPVEFSGSIDTECNTITHALGDKLMLLLWSISYLFIIMILSFIISIELGLFSLVPIPLHVLASYLLIKSTRDFAREKQERYRVAGGIAEESIEGVKTIASCNAQEFRARRYLKELESIRRFATDTGVIFGIAWGIVYALFFTYAGAAYYFCAYLISNDYETWTGTDLDARAVNVVVLSTGFYCLSFGQVLPCFEYVESGRVAVAKIEAFINRTKKFDGNIKPDRIRGSIEFEQVYFNYPTKAEIFVLQGVSFKVEEGQSLAVVGETGSGKSTIIQLLEGFYYSSAGSVKIDGVDLRDYDLHALRAYISLVNQEPILFNCSIKDNIKIGCENATEAEVYEAAKEAEALDYILALPQQFETWTGVKGGLLSGGQKQRIALARAMIKKPKILLLDEATSALDNNTANRIQETIEKLMQGTTTIIVAHNLSTIKKANNIIVLHNGLVVETGTYEELTLASGRFSNLHKIQQQASQMSEKLSPAPENKHESSSKHLFQVSEEMERPSGAVFIRVIKMLRPYWLYLALAMAGALFAGASIPVFSYFFARDNNIIVGIEGDDMEGDTRQNFFCILIDSVVVFLATILMCWALAKVSASFTYNLRYQCMRALLYFDQQFYDMPNNTAPLIAARLASDCESVATIGGTIFGLQVLVLTNMIGGIVIGFVFDPVLALVISAFFPLILYVGAKSQALSTAGIANINLKNTSEIASDTIVNIKTVHSFNREMYFCGKYIEATKDEIKKMIPAGNCNSILFGLRFFLMFIMYGTVAWFGAYRVKEGDLDMEDMLIVFYSVMFTYFGLLIVGSFAPDVEGGINSGKRLFAIIDYFPEINANSDIGSTHPIKGDIEFRNVDFKYRSRNDLVLKSLSFSIKSGSTLGITGTTGSGKTTISQLLLRFYDPIAGKILLDSKDLASYNIKHLRDSISWVGQEPMLFYGTIYYNMQLARPDISETEARAVMKKAQASDIVTKYGLNCSVGWRGSELSGGQKQRIAIARALARKPKVLVMDESTSALDLTTEKNVIRHLRKEGCTIISIAHRLQSIKDYDQILLIENGFVIERGTHRELMEKRNGFYKSLFKKSN